MSAERIYDAYACRDPLELNEDRLPWLTEALECAICGIKLLNVRPVGIGILDEDDVRCERCEELG